MIFDPGRPLGDFSAKIHLGYLLLMYDNDEYSALRSIAEIRNVFAHRLNISSFEAKNEKLAASFGGLKLHEKHKMFLAPFWDGHIESAVPSYELAVIF